MEWGTFAGYFSGVVALIIALFTIAYKAGMFKQSFQEVPALTTGLKLLQTDLKELRKELEAKLKEYHKEWQAEHHMLEIAVQQLREVATENKVEIKHQKQLREELLATLEKIREKV